MIGIYKITNPEGQIYIGLSKNIEKRFNQHKNFQFKGNNKLRESLTKYGGDSHLFEVLEEVDISSYTRDEGNALLRRCERYWINKLQTYSNGLNENKGGSGCTSHTKESKHKISKANSKPKPSNFGINRKKWQHTKDFKEKVKNAKRRPILMYDKEGNLVGEFPNNARAADYIGCQKSAIWNVLNGYKSLNAKTTTTHVKGYTFKYL
jgi:group I intron endonuclease